MSYLVYCLQDGARKMMVPVFDSCTHLRCLAFGKNCFRAGEAKFHLGLQQSQHIDKRSSTGGLPRYVCIHFCTAPALASYMYDVAAQIQATFLFFEELAAATSRTWVVPWSCGSWSAGHTGLAHKYRNSSHYRLELA